MNERLALVFGLSAVILWSTVATAFKLTLSELTPVQMLTVASIVSAMVLTITCAIQGKLSQVYSVFMSRPGYYLLLGLINPLAYYLILFKAYDLLPASEAQAINYSWAITLTLMAAVFLGHKIRRIDWLGCSVSYIGVIVIATKGHLSGMTFENPLGVSLAFLSTLLWATYWVLNTKNKADPIIGLLCGFLIAIPFAVVLSIYEGAHWQQISTTGWMAVVYVGLFEMGITFILWLHALKLTRNTARISNLIFISPFISLVLLATVIGEKIQPSTLVGLVLIIGGLVIQQLKRWPRLSP